MNHSERRTSTKPSKLAENVPDSDRPPNLRFDVEDDEHLRERGRRIQQLRKLRGLTQEELGRRLGMPQGQLSNYESGKRGMTATTAQLLAKALGLSVDELLGSEALPAANAEDADIASDPYPNRRRLRRLPEFIEGPEEVRDYVVNLRRSSGDMGFFEWCAKYTSLLKTYEEGDWDSLFATKDPPVKKRRIR